MLRVRAPCYVGSARWQHWLAHALLAGAHCCLGTCHSHTLGFELLPRVDFTTTKDLNLTLDYGADSRCCDCLPWLINGPCCSEC
ncbi:hypothetical protein GE09DRAFT_1154820 [Coniochaeta sp. 2T2.1]|nr:hypothetical protein GE09DRAFT_1154820 [Coniochaeta sp. 2T2.1]